MAVTQTQREATRKTLLLLAAVIAEAKAAGMSGLPSVLVKVSGVGSAARFSAVVTHEESVGVFRACTIAGNDGRVKIFSKLDDVLSAVVTAAPAIGMLPVGDEFALTIDNPEALAPAPSTAIATVTTLTKKLLSLRESKKSATLQSGIRALEITGNAALATGTAEQQAKYAEIVLRKVVIDDLITLYVSQDAALVALITSLGGTPPGSPS